MDTQRPESTSPARRPRLFDAYPGLQDRVAWMPLGVRVTPVQPFEAAGGAAWVKRDDLTATPYGGNKVRKLEYLLAAAKRARATRLVTVGAAGSHHALATALYGTRAGFRVSLVLFPQRVTPSVEQALLIDHAVGAELRFTRRLETVPMALAAARLAHRSERVRVVAPGGSDAVGTLGYADAALELAAQVAAGRCPAPAAVYVAAGTLGTAAGLALGFALAGLETRVVAARITTSLVTNQRALRRLITGATAVLGRAGVRAPATADVCRGVELVHDFLGAGYGIESPEGRRAGERFAEAGLGLDPTYTAKAAAAFLRAAEQGADGPILFWHTYSATVPEELAREVTVDELPAPFRSYLERARARRLG